MECYPHPGRFCLPVIEARLPPEQGALFIKALEAADAELREAQWKAEGATAESSAASWGQRQADALARCAEASLAGDGKSLPPGERHQVHVHIDVEALCNPEAKGESAIADGPRIPPETVRRLTCDGSLVTHFQDGEGRGLDAGRRTRVIPPAMRRALVRRDGGCRFPGCSCQRFVDGHHIEHWADGGETTLDNLVLLCRHHHRLVHELGFEVRRDDGHLHFYRPDGAPIEDAPALPKPVPPQWSIQLDPRSAVPHWMGEPMDYSYCLSALDQRRERADAAQDDSAELLH